MNTRCTIAGMLIGLAGSFTLYAGELMPAHVSAEAQWIGHINIEGIQAIPQVQKLREKMMAKDKVQARLQEIKEKTGVDPSNVIKGITMYADGYEGKQGVVLVYVKEFDRDKLSEWFLEKHPENTTTEHNGLEIYTWTAKHKRHEMELSGTFANEEIVVVGCTVEAVKNALDVIGDEGKGLAPDAELIVGTTKNDLAFAHAMNVPEEYSNTTMCPVLHIVSAARGQWQYADDTLNGHYELATRSEESAQNIKAVIDGFKAMGELRYQDADAVRKVINSLKINIEGQDVTVDFTASMDELQAGVKAAIAHQPAARPRRG